MVFILLFSLFFFSVGMQAQSTDEKPAMMTDLIKTQKEAQAKKDLENSRKIQKQKQKAEKEAARRGGKKSKASEPFIMEKTAGKVYVFGVSQSLGGDLVYITEICTIDSIALQKKTNFLPFRSSFSVQLQRYTEGVLGQSNQTVSIFFSDKMDKLTKTLKDVKKRYLANDNKTVNTITHDDFYFIHPLDMIGNASEAEQTAEGSL